MAQVPYSPVPDVVPSVPGPARVGIDTPPAAFGAATAAATRQLGQQAEQSSNEMFQTYLYSKQLENDTWAKNNFVDQSAKIGEVENALYGLKGQEAVNAAPKAAQQIQQIYRDAIANAPNPQAGRMLGDQLSRRIAYSLVDIGRHSGQQRLAAAGDASASTVAVGMDLISKSPYNDDLFQDYVRDGGVIDQEASTLERLGFGKAAANAIKLKNQAWEARFESLYGKPDQAQALYDQNKKDIPPGAKANIIRQIRSSESTVKFNATYTAAVDKAQAERDVSAISSEGRIVDPVTGQVGYSPDTVAKLVKYGKDNPAADEKVNERLGWVRKTNEDAAKGLQIQSNPGVISAIRDHMFDVDPTTQTTERDLAKAQNDRSISPEDLGIALKTIEMRDRGSFTDPALKDTLAAVKNKLEWESLQRGDIVGGADALARFDRAFYPQYERLLNAGRGMAVGALNMDDPNSLVSQSMTAARNSTSFQERIKAAAEPPPAKVPPPSQRLQGETPSEWLARRMKSMPEVPQSR